MSFGRKRGPPESTEGAEPDEGNGPVGTLRQMQSVLRPLGRKRVLLATLLLLGGVAGVLVLASGFSFWWTSQPSFCARCHPMQEFVAAWEDSTHADVNCEKCHLTPGLFGFLGGKIAGLQVVMNYARGRFEDYSFNAVVGNASCLQCHENVMSKNVHADSSVGVLVSHKNIVESGGKCISCHSTVGHPAAIPAGAQTHPTMATCVQCHNDETAPLRCNLCHVNRNPPTGSPPASPPPVTGASPAAAAGLEPSGLALRGG